MSFGSLFEDPLGTLNPLLALARKLAIEIRKKHYRDLFRLQPLTLFVAGAGNDSGQPAERFFPAALSLDSTVGSQVISVGAVGSGWTIGPFNDRADSRASFSNIGKGVSVAAPGTGVLSVDVGRASLPYICRGPAVPQVTTNSGTGPVPWDVFCGTSAATPVVAGAAALLKALDPSLTPLEIKLVIQQTATPIAAAAWGNWADPRRLDIAAAVQRVLAFRGASGPFPGLALSLGLVAEEDGTTPFNPGRKRYLWVPDSRNDRLVRLQLRPGFDDDFSKAEPKVPAGDLRAAGCVQPVAIEGSPSGDKLFIACRGSQRLLVWNANTDEPARFQFNGASVSATIGLPHPITPELPVEMALSPDGRTLAVPLAGRRVAFVNTRTHELSSLRYALNAKRGELRALGFVHEFSGEGRATLFAVTSGTEPALVRTQEVGDPPYWPISSASRLKVRDLKPIGIRPQTLGVQDFDDSMHVYPVYAGPRISAVPVAASAHDDTHLSLVAGATADGLMESTLPGRTFDVSGRTVTMPNFGAQDFVFDATLPDSLLSTAVAGARDMVVDRERKLAWILFRLTGNVGLSLFEGGSRSFQQVSGATRINGTFFGPRSQIGLTVGRDPTPVAGGAGTAVTSPVDRTVDFTQGRFYIQSQFPSSLEIEQGGGLLASHFAGSPPVLRVYNAVRMKQAFDRIDGHPIVSPADTPLEEGDAQPLAAEFPDSSSFPVQAAHDLAFMPRISVAAPAGGTVQHGDLSVHLLLHDEGITRVRCRILDDVGAQILPPVERNLNDAERKLGVTLGNQPACRFASFTAGDWVLEVAGFKGAELAAVARVPFRKSPP
jgi:hypothetical protein